MVSAMSRRGTLPSVNIIRAALFRCIPTFGADESSCQSGEVQGLLTAGRCREYVPDSFVATQHEAAYAFFSANGYLDQETAATMQVDTHSGTFVQTDAGEYLTKCYRYLFVLGERRRTVRGQGQK